MQIVEPPSAASPKPEASGPAPSDSSISANGDAPGLPALALLLRALGGMREAG